MAYEDGGPVGNLFFLWEEGDNRIRMGVSLGSVPLFDRP